MDAPAALETSVEPDSRVANPSIGAACMMSSALPAATVPVLVDQPDFARHASAREQVRQRPSQLAGSDDGDIAHWWAIVMARGPDGGLAARRRTWKVRPASRVDVGHPASMAGISAM